MLITISILPLILLVINGATSKRVPRRHTEIIRTRNHPPAVENYDFISGTLIYQEEVESPKRRSLKKIGIMNGDEKEPSIKVLKPETRSVNHPPLATYSNDFPIEVALDSEFESEELLNPKKKAKSLDVLSTKIMENFFAEKDINTSNQGQRRRSQQVRKAQLNKSQLQKYINETEISINKTENAINGSEQPRINENQSKNYINQNIPKRRKDSLKPVVPIIESESYVFSHSGDFHYSYEGGDGTKAYEKGELKNSNGGAGSAVEGSFSYKGEDGVDYSLTYTADENGYRPVGAHLPTPPPIPPAIQRALDYLATITTPAPVTKKIAIT